MGELVIELGLAGLAEEQSASHQVWGQMHYSLEAALSAVELLHLEGKFGLSSMQWCVGRERLCW